MPAREGQTTTTAREQVADDEHFRATRTRATICPTTQLTSGNGRSKFIVDASGRPSSPTWKREHLPCTIQGARFQSRAQRREQASTVENHQDAGGGDAKTDDQQTGATQELTHNRLPWPNNSAASVTGIARRALTKPETRVHRGFIRAMRCPAGSAQKNLFGFRKKPRIRQPFGARATCRLPAGRHTKLPAVTSPSSSTRLPSRMNDCSISVCW